MRGALLALGLAAAGLIGASRPAAAAAWARGDGGVVHRLAALPLTVTQTSDTALTLDSNNPTGSGPHAMYVSYRITNTSAASVANLSATLSGFSGGVVLGGGQVATQYVGTLAAGQSRTVFWFITYSSTIGVRTLLQVDVTDGAGGTATGTGAVKTLSMISAQAGGLTSSASIGAGAVVGQLINLDVTYQFKGWGVDDTFNLQPAGNTNFAGGCFQLVSSTVVSADAPLNQVIVPGTANVSYFKATVSSGGGGATWNVAMRYTFRYLCAGTTATPLPYSNELSGGQLKYSSNYGSAAASPNPIPAAPAPAASFTFGKTAAALQLPNGGTETYTVAVKNISTFDVTVDEIRDVLPAGVSYVGVTAASGVTAANSSAMPAAGATGTISFKGTPGSSYAIAPGATLNLVYTTTVSATPGQYVNSASGYVGTTSIGTGSATVTVGTADITVTKTGPATAAMQDTLKYLVTVGNTGPSTAYAVVVRDTLPSGVTFVRATNGGTASGGVVTWPAVGSIAVGATVTDSVIVLAPNTMTTLVNRGAAATASYDPVSTNNDGSATTSAVSTTLTLAIAVSPKGPSTPVKRLPGTAYAQPFTVSNVSVFSGSYHLVAATSGTPAFLTIDSLTGPGITTRVRPDSAVVTLAPHSDSVYKVWYTVPVGDTVTNTEILRARNTVTPATADTGWVPLRRSFPTLAMTKTVSPTGVVQPGIDIVYTMKFRNTGEYDATQVIVSDIVPAGVYFKLASITQSLPSGITATLSYSKDGGSTFTYTPLSGGCGAPLGYDGCVNRVRWSLSQPLPPSPTQSTVTFGARIR